MAKKIEELEKLEKHIRINYGEIAIVNPKSLWNKEKEDKFREDFLRLEREKKEKQEIIEEVDGIVVRKNKKNNKIEEKKCLRCNLIIKNSIDIVSYEKFECCYNCYIKYFEDREKKF